MRVIFLDFDGVLNSKRWFQSRPHTPNLLSELDGEAVAHLNAVLDRSGAKVVISSSWRAFGMPHILRCLDAAGFRGEVIGQTPRLHRTPDGEERVRGHEIQGWLDEHPEVTAFAILDDDADMAHLLPRLVRTSFETGLLPEHVERVIAVLGDQDGWRAGGR